MTSAAHNASSALRRDIPRLHFHARPRRSARVRHSDLARFVGEELKVIVLPIHGEDLLASAWVNQLQTDLESERAAGIGHRHARGTLAGVPVEARRNRESRDRKLR